MTAPKTESSPADLVRFRWQRLEEASLIDVRGEAVLVGWPADEWYEPLRFERALFEEFARLPDEPEAFVAFAEAYGTLDTSRRVSREVDGPGGIPLAVWRAHRDLLRFAVDLWDAVEEGRADDIIGRQVTVVDLGTEAPALFQKYTGSPQVAQVNAPIGEAVEITYCWAMNEFFTHDRPEPERETSIAHLERRNLSPTAIARAALAQFVTRNCLDLSVAMMVTTAPGAPLRMTFQVDSLIAAMWLQLLLAIDGKRKYRSCPVCGRWWDATAARSDKLTCSDRCRKSKQRAQKTDRKEGD